MFAFHLFLSLSCLIDRTLSMDNARDTVRQASEALPITRSIRSYDFILALHYDELSREKTITLFERLLEDSQESESALSYVQPLFANDDASTLQMTKEEFTSFAGNCILWKDTKPKVEHCRTDDMMQSKSQYTTRYVLFCCSSEHGTDNRWLSFNGIKIETHDSDTSQRTVEEYSEKLEEIQDESIREFRFVQNPKMPDEMDSSFAARAIRDLQDNLENVQFIRDEFQSQMDEFGADSGSWTKEQLKIIEKRPAQREISQKKFSEHMKCRFVNAGEEIKRTSRFKEGDMRQKLECCDLILRELTEEKATVFNRMPLGLAGTVENPEQIARSQTQSAEFAEFLENVRMAQRDLFEIKQRSSAIPDTLDERMLDPVVGSDDLCIRLEKAENELLRQSEEYGQQILVIACTAGGVFVLIAIIFVVWRRNYNNKKDKDLKHALKAQSERIMIEGEPLPVIPSAHANRLGVHEHPAVRDQFGMNEVFDVTAGEGEDLVRIARPLETAGAERKLSEELLDIQPIYHDQEGVQASMAQRTSTPGATPGEDQPNII